MARTKASRQGYVATVLMGLGHIRAAWPLRDVAKDGLILYSAKECCSPKEFKVWDGMLRLYYFLSKAEKIPLIGRLIYALLEKAEEIPPRYPKVLRPRPTPQVRYLHSLIRKGLVQALAEKVQADPRPIVSAYFALSIGLDHHLPDFKENYLLCTDTDLNRVWAPLDPAKTNIIFLAPCQTAADRLVSYGVPPSRIITTGFPLPKENIGSEKDAEVLKHDLWERLLRLDPRNVLIGGHKDLVETVLGRRALPKRRDDAYTVMFAIGGAGAQFEIAEEALHSLKGRIREGKVRFVLSGGTKPRIGERFRKVVRKAGLEDLWDRGVGLVCDADHRSYLDQFNRTIRTVDVLWTKPSELVFYAGLALPILCAPPIGPQEVWNRDWVVNMNAGMPMPAEARYCHEWLEDMRQDGRLAWAAFNGFLRAPRNGTFNIERILKGERLRT